MLFMAVVVVATTECAARVPGTVWIPVLATIREPLPVLVTSTGRRMNQREEK